MTLVRYRQGHLPRFVAGAGAESRIATEPVLILITDGGTSGKRHAHTKEYALSRIAVEFACKSWLRGCILGPHSLQNSD